MSTDLLVLTDEPMLVVRAPRLISQETRVAVLVPFCRGALRCRSLLFGEREVLWLALEGVFDPRELLRIALGNGLGVPVEFIPERRAA